MRAFRHFLLLAATMAAAGCVFFGPDRIGGRVICDVSGETGETCFLDYQFDEVYQDTGYIDITKDFSRELKGVGTVLQAGDTYGISYLGNIRNCANANAPGGGRLEVAESVVSDPAEDFSEPYAMSPREFGRFESVRRLGPRFREIREVQVRFGTVKKAELNEDEVRNLILKGVSSLPVVCRSWLRDDTYIVTRTLLVDAFEYKFKGLFNRTLFVDEDSLNDFVTFSSDVNYTVSDRGTIQVNDPHDVAIGGSLAIEAFGFEPEPLPDVLSRYYLFIERYSKID